MYAIRSYYGSKILSGSVPLSGLQISNCEELDSRLRGNDGGCFANSVCSRERSRPGERIRITSYNVCYTKLLRHQLGYSVKLVPLGSDILAFAEEVWASRPDVVFNLCEGFWGDSRKELHVAAMLDLVGVAYTGSGPLSLGLTSYNFV